MQGILLLAVSFHCTLGLINDFVNQATTLQTYADDLKYYHAFFDISFLDGGNLVQGDKDYSYFIARTSARSVSTFQFVRSSNADTSTEIIHESIQLEDYKVYGMCQNEGTLDYLIAKHLESQEIRVVRFYEADGVMYILDYKTVDKDEYMYLTDEVHVDCTYNGKYQDQNTYVAAIGGTYFHENGLSSYYLAKFNTRYNMTEYFIKSQDDTVMEQTKGVRVDINNQMLYVAVEINKNKYHGMTVYEPGTLPEPDNSNIAIIGYTWDFAVRQWVVVTGNEKYQDKYVNMQPWGKHLYVALNSYSTMYSTNSSQTDIYYYDIHAWNGYTNKHIVFGSPTTDSAYDIHVNQGGIYMLAEIGDVFLPHKDTSYQWATQNGQANLVLMWINFDNEIVNMEGYDVTQLEEPHPRRFVLQERQLHTNQFTFYTHRSQDWEGGIFITKYTDASLVFTTDVDCGTGCSFCDSKYKEYCLECDTSSDYYFFQHQCHISSCPDFSYEHYNEANVNQFMCKNCHFSCRTCSGPWESQCSTCCMNNDCGAIYNRVPNSGYCECTAAQVESNGVCLSRCIENLAGRRGDHCHTQCPSNSLAYTAFDQPVAQERTQYDSGTVDVCSDYEYHLQFERTGKGLAVLGPKDLTTMPSEFTIAFWVYPTSLNIESVLINAFERVYVTAQSGSNSLLFKFKTSSTPTYEQPDYISSGSNNNIVPNTWNYVSASQREYLDGNIMKYEQQFGVANGRSATVLDAGYRNDQTATTYPFFINTIYIGADSDSDPKSFSGYLKELKIFDTYHSLPQMVDEKLRIMRYYSFDDSHLVAYWKLIEQYTSDDLEYTVYDYSQYQNEMTYSWVSDPDYPVFVQDGGIKLNLCYYHDVKTCLSVDYEGTYPIVTHGKRYASAPTLQLADQDHIIGDGDQIWFLPNNTDCSESDEMETFLEYSTIYGQWLADDLDNSPAELREASHYQMCYYMADKDLVFNLMQVYVAGMVRSVNPANNNIFQISSVYRDFETGGGDQAYGDVIKFSTDCDYTNGIDYQAVRDNAGAYETIEVSTLQTTGEFFFCWKPQFIQESQTPYYESVHGLRYKVISRPVIASTAPPSTEMNERFIRFDLEGSFVEGDQLTLSWRGVAFADCNPVNFLGDVYTYNHTHWPSVWFGYGSGIHGVDTYEMDELHLCWKPVANSAPSAWIRLKKTTGGSYQIRLNEYDQAVNINCPELMTFDPAYGAATLTEADTEIKFGFLDREVYPSKKGLNLGKIAIFRGAVKPDGSIVKMSDTLWQKNDLDETGIDPFTQGDLICTQTGTCSIFLTESSSRMGAGEVYFLSFYKDSFSAFDSGGTQYYLFNDVDLLPGQTTVYDHFFVCRSFDITPSTQAIQGNSFSIQGVDLRYKSIKLKEQSGSIVTATFHTRAINLYVSIENTDSAYCVSELLDPPVATVAMEDVEDSSFTVENLDLGECLEGDLFADIEMVRGIKASDGSYTHERREKMYGVQLGSITCDQSCLRCNGTTENDCMICADQTHFLYFGTCLAECPADAQTYFVQTADFQSQRYIQQLCLPECPHGMYADGATSECLVCNPDCQTCSSSLIASCSSCNPIKYLISGICITNCPSPHHQNNYADYTCDEISQTPGLSVQIQTLGYKNRVPKDVQVYMKVAIAAADDDEVVSIQWQQLEPEVATLADDASIFNKDDNGNYDNTASVIPIRASAFNFMSSKQPVKVQVTVTTAGGLQNYNLYEFYLNDPPVTGDINTDIVWHAENKDILASIDSIVHCDLVDWYDDSDDTSQQLDIYGYLLVSGDMFLLTDAFKQDEFWIRPPLISTDTVEDDITVQLCFGAIDQYQGIGSNCRNEETLRNNLNYLENYEAVAEHLLGLTYSSTNLTDSLYAANVLFFAIQQPLRLPIFPGICTMDYHCSSNGACNAQGGIQRCTCDQGFEGTYCDFKGRELADLQGIASDIIDALYERYATKYEIEPFDIIAIMNVLKGVTQSPDLVTEEYFEKVVQLITLVSEAPIYSHWPLPDDVTTMVLNSYSNIIIKLHHQYKKNRAYDDTDGLGEGQTLSEYTASLTSSSSETVERRLLRQKSARYMATQMGETVKGLTDNNNSTSQQGRMLVQEKSYKYSAISNKPLGIGGNPNKLSQANRRSLFSQAKADQFEDWGRRVDESINGFIGMLTAKLNPSANSKYFKGQAFELYAQSDFSTEFKDKTFKIRYNDMYWKTPSNLFENNQGQASDLHEVKLVLVKWLANPYLFEQSANGHAETNVTTFSFFDVTGAHIDVVQEEASPVQIREPYIKAEAYEEELLRCMSWNAVSNEFDNDGTCAFTLMQDQLPCDDCDGSEVTAVVSNCRCTHMSVFAGAYQMTAPGSGFGPTIGIYSDLFAMNQWSQSFGWFAVLSGMTTFFIGHLIIHFVDNRLQEKMVLALREKVRKVQMKTQDDGKNGGLTKKSLAELNREDDEDQRGLRQEPDGDEEQPPGPAMERTAGRSNGFGNSSRSKGPTKKRLNKAKKVKDQVDSDGFEGGENEQDPYGQEQYPPEGDQQQQYDDQNAQYADQNAQYEEQNNYGQQDYGQEAYDPNAYGQEQAYDDYGQEAQAYGNEVQQNYQDYGQENYPEGMNEYGNEIEFEAIGPDVAEKKQHKKKSKAKGKDESLEIVGESEGSNEDTGNRPSSVQSSKTKMGDAKSEAGGNKSKSKNSRKSEMISNMQAAMNVNVNMEAQKTGNKDIAENFNQAYLAKKQRDEDKNNPRLKKYMKREAKRQEARQFQFKQMIIRANLPLSLLFITSIHSPRHVRWTLLIAAISLIWFCCAVVYNNTKDPLQIPDFTREAKNVASDDIWISFLAPWGTMILMYIFTGLFKIAEGRIKASTRVDTLDKMLIELKKEMKLRFIMGYFIICGIFAMIYIYIISFSARFGWQVSWAWWWTGVYAIALHFFLIDPAISASHWVIYKCSRQLALFIMKIRSLKQADEEAA